MLNTEPKMLLLENNPAVVSSFTDFPLLVGRVVVVANAEQCRQALTSGMPFFSGDGPL